MKNYFLFCFAFLLNIATAFAQVLVQDAHKIEVSAQHFLSAPMLEQSATVMVYPLLDSTNIKSAQTVCAAFGQLYAPDTVIYFAAANVESAAAYVTSAGKKYVVVNESFVVGSMMFSSDKTLQDCLFMLILAHELAHLSCQHTAENHSEMEADYKAAYLLAKMGVDKTTLLAAANLLFQNHIAGIPFPDTDKRLYAIERGFDNALKF